MLRLQPLSNQKALIILVLFLGFVGMLCLFCVVFLTAVSRP